MPFLYNNDTVVLMFHFQIQRYIHHQDHHYVLLIRVCNEHINKLKTNDPCKAWVKSI